MRATILALVTVLGGCGAAAGATQAPRTGRVWVEQSHPLPRGADRFAMAVRADEVLVTPLGTWNEPLDVQGVVLSAGRRRTGHAIRVRSPHWRGENELALRVGDERVVLQYDAPVGAAPIEPGERVRIVALSMSDGAQLGFSLSVLDHRGHARLIGVRLGDPHAALLPEGWSVERGPVLRWICGPGHGAVRGVRVRGPGGDIIAEPGRTAVARLGADGARYAVDLMVDRPPHAACDSEAGQLSVVVRRLEGGGPTRTEAGSRASL